MTSAEPTRMHAWVCGMLQVRPPDLEALASAFSFLSQGLLRDCRHREVNGHTNSGSGRSLSTLLRGLRTLEMALKDAGAIRFEKEQNIDIAHVPLHTNSTLWTFWKVFGFG